MTLIDRKELLFWMKQRLELDFADTLTYLDAIEEVEKAPAFEISGRPHGTWVLQNEDENDGSDYECSVCGEWVLVRSVELPRYCPDCGARMHGWRLADETSKQMDT